MPAYGLRDGLLSVTRAFSNGAGNVTSTAIDTRNSSNGDFVAPCELLIESPVLTTTQLPDTNTMTFDVVHSDNSDLSSPSTLAAGVLVQTGAGGAGAAVASARIKLPTNVKRYVGVKATKTGTGDASAKSFTASLVF